MITRLELQQYRRMNDRHRRSPEAKAFRRRLDAEIAQLPPEHRAVITLRYCCRLSWVAVTMRMPYSDRQVYRIHRAAVKMLEES